MIERRRFLRFAAACGLTPLAAWSQEHALRRADMHSHAGVHHPLDSLRAAMERNGMLVVARKIVADRPVIRTTRGRISVFREAQLGELARRFDEKLDQLHAGHRREGLVEIDSVEALDRVVATRVPGVVLCAEGGDFLEGDAQRLEQARRAGLAHLQLVHYRVSEVGDISTAAPRYDGLSPFGRDVVGACNRLGILLDVARGSSALIDQALELSTQPLIYSHGQVSSAAPFHTHNVIAARAIHLPLARKIAQRGGVIGLWPNRTSFPTLESFADALLQLAQTVGIDHAGVGTDMEGMPSTVIPDYAQFAQLADILAARAMQTADLDKLLCGNYLRVLRHALAA